MCSSSLCAGDNLTVNIKKVKSLILRGELGKSIGTLHIQFLICLAVLQ